MKQELIQALGRFVKRIIWKEKVRPMPGIVKSVDENARTCEVKPDDGGPPLKCRLQSVEDGKLGWVLIPSQDASVLYEQIEGSRGVVVATMDVQKVLLDCDEIVVNGGDNGELIVWDALKGELEKEKNRVDLLYQAINTAGFTAQDGGKLLQSNMKGIIASGQPPNYGNSKILDDKFTH